MYWIKVFRRWVDYADMLLGAWLIAIWFLYSIYSQDGGFISALSSASNHSSGGRGLGLLLIILGPLFNLYVWYKWSDFFAEAEDDVFRKHENPPSKGIRMAVIKAFSMLIGVVFFPVFIWFYSSDIELLWPKDMATLHSPGFVLSVFVSVVGVYLIPKCFPNFGKHFKRVDSGIEKVIESKNKKMK